MRLNHCTFLLAVAILAATPSAAKSPYVTAEQLDLMPFLPPPPPAGSPQEQAEMREVMALQNGRTAERAAQCAADAAETVYAMFTPVLGAGFNAAALPKTDLLFTRVGDSEGSTIDVLKQFYGRKRPFMVSDAVKPAAPLSKSGAYPSGHATRAAMMGIVLAELLPEKRDAIWARLDDYAESRVIGGLHMRSDIEAGKRAGIAIAAALLSNAAFRADFEQAREELRPALSLPASH